MLFPTILWVQLRRFPAGLSMSNIARQASDLVNGLPRAIIYMQRGYIPSTLLMRLLNIYFFSFSTAPIFYTDKIFITAVIYVAS